MKFLRWEIGVLQNFSCTCVFFVLFLNNNNLLTSQTKPSQEEKDSGKTDTHTRPCILDTAGIKKRQKQKVKTQPKHQYPSSAYILKVAGYQPHQRN